MSKKKTKKSGLNMRLTLIIFALLPMLISSIIIGSVLVNTSSSELKTSTHNSMVAIIDGIGESFDYSTKTSEKTLMSFAKEPVFMDYLKNPEDAEKAAKAQAYTRDFFESVDGWEGMYLADWNTKTLTHSNEGTVGLVLREGDRLTSLQSSLLAADGVHNAGIITSPASGQLVMSMYVPIFDEDGTPLGFVGGGIFVNNIVVNFSDVTALGLSSAYVYFVDKEGVMLYHPDESKVGNPVENEAVKGVVAKIAAGEHPASASVEYNYKGAMKYAAYYVGLNENYIAVLTADESDVMTGVNQVTIITLLICLVCIVIFAIVAFIVSRTVSAPLTKVATAIEVLSTGDVTVECNIKSTISETSSVINAFGALKDSLLSSMSNVKNSAFALNSAIINVDGMTTNNVDAVTQINNAIGEVASTSQVVAENAQRMAEEAADLGMNIETLNDNVTKLFDASMIIRNANEEATDCMKAVYAGANESVEAMKNISDKIAETNEAIEGIGSAVQAIESIASQTNLLSLNASIEAARAGEAGRGFAVVADEIRTLADSSAESAREIKQIIENVISLSNVTVDISNRVFEVIRKEQSDIETTQQKFIVLSDSVEASITEIDTIKRMAGVLDNIKAELTNATTDLGAISEELGASAEEVAATCQTVTLACTDTQASTQEMRDINENMSTVIDFFKLS